MLDAIRNSALDQLVLSDSEVAIMHLYIEPVMVPLNLYIKRYNEFQLQVVIADYGCEIKELAAANFFSGDMLLKNFGVTRQVRVVSETMTKSTILPR